MTRRLDVPVVLAALMLVGAAAHLERPVRYAAALAADGMRVLIESVSP